MATASEPQRVPEGLIRKISALPLARVAEVEDFVDFIGQREAENALKKAVCDASAPALASVWNNPGDDDYDAL